ncbi:MGMT family protein [Psychromonas hadalis]|uniref:MGMT family protein n=1 Tax=Psychromonas hadalis TaxID=211669 RepID=UPI0003B30F33|nr:MGMT family protein [Psychromonas hadalis]
MLNSFNQRCYDLLKLIPEGYVVTYGDIAHALGGKAYQAVGNAMASNPNPIVVPCHRVVKANGDIGNYAYGVPKKIALLHSEGIKTAQSKIINFTTVRFIF